MTTYSPKAPTSMGVALSLVAVASGDKVPPGVILIVRNTGGTTGTVTMVTNDTADGDLTVGDRTTNTIAATTGFAAIKVPYNALYVGADGLVTLNFTGGTLTYDVISAG